MAEGWSRRFDEPIPLPNGSKLVTLKDAIAWLAKEVPKSEHSMKEVQAAAHCITEAAENDDVRPDGHDAGDQPAQARGVRSETQKPALGKTQACEGPMSRARA